MAHFYVSAGGQAKTTATRCGTKSSGVHAHTRGYDVGVYTHALYNTDADRDEVEIRLTHGSTGKGATCYIGKVVYEGETAYFVPGNILPDLIAHAKRRGDNKVRY